jgi:N,N'-diacetyllegionaminate synthase
MPLSASVFDERGLDLLDVIDAPYIKLASCDLNNGPLLCAAAERGRTLILSTGMSSLAEVERAVTQATNAGAKELVLLHCVSVYPCPLDEINVGFVATLRTEFDTAVGLSDHTESSVAAAMAVALGATWIEKHFTLDRAAQGFDHHYAMEPEQLAAFVEDVRGSSAAMTAPPAKVGNQEMTVRSRARRGLFAARDLEAGAVVEPDDVLIVRPESELTPNDLEMVVGRALTKPVRQHEAFRPDQLA